MTMTKGFNYQVKLTSAKAKLAELQSREDEASNVYGNLELSKQLRKDITAIKETIEELESLINEEA